MRIVSLSDECLCPADAEDLMLNRDSIFGSHVERDDDEMEAFLNSCLGDEEEDEG